MARLRRSSGLELVTGDEKCRNLMVSEEMRHIPVDGTEASSRKHVGICNTDRLHILAKFADRRYPATMRCRMLPVLGFRPAPDQLST